MPNPTIAANLSDYITDPAWRAFLHGFYTGGQFEVILLFLAIAFFIDLDMLASIIIFYWLSKVPFWFGEVFGWKTLPGIQDRFPYFFEQHIGAFLALAILTLWTARKHLLAVGRRILGQPGGEDDSEEAVSYRAALFISLAALAYLGLWGHLTGLGVGSALIFFGFLMVCGFSAARLRSEVGVPATYFTPYWPMLIFHLMGGVKIFGLSTMLLTYAAGGFMAVAQFLMFAPSQVELLQLARVQNASPRGLSIGMTVGAICGILVGGYVVMVWCYGIGGENIPYMRDWAMGQSWYFLSLRQAFLDLDAAMTAQQTAEAAERASKIIGPWISVAAGALITIALAALRSYFAGFWLHPLGYVLANTYCVYMCWGSLHVAWLLKYLGLKISGPRFIRERMMPFFGGVFCGAVAGQILWTAVALLALWRGYKDVFLAFP